MLLEFISQNRAELIRRTRDKVRSRSSPRATPEELESGVPLFLSQVTDLLAATHVPLAVHGETLTPAIPARGRAAKHGNALLKRGFTIAQVVHDYGDVCQAITELAGEHKELFSTTEFHLLNLCLDNAIAEAVTEYSRQREQNIAEAEVERLGFFAHALRNLLSTATMAYQVLRSGTVAIGGGARARPGARRRGR